MVDDGIKFLKEHKFIAGEWYVVNNETFARVAAQVGTYGHHRRKVDYYYVDGHVFICEKGRKGAFRVIGAFSANAQESEFEKNRKQAIARLADARKRGYNVSPELLKNAFRRAESDNNGIGNASATKSVLALDAERAPEETSDAQSGYDATTVYSSDGKLVAYQITPELADILNGALEQRVMFQIIRAYHGTAAEFEKKEGAPYGKLNDKFMGSGEGAQAFGWGHYLTNKIKIAEDYAKRIARGKLGMKGFFAIQGEFYNKYREMITNGEAPKWERFGKTLDEAIVYWRDHYTDDKAKRFFKEEREFYLALIGRYEADIAYNKNLLRDYSNDYTPNGIKEIKGKIKKLEQDVADAQKVLDEYLSETEKIFNKIMDSPEIKSLTKSRYIYTAEFDDDTLLEWNTPLTDEQWARVSDTIMANPLKYFRSEEEAKDFVGNNAFADNGHPTPLYLHNTYIRKRDGAYPARLMSTLLRDAGFVGHMFPADSYGSGDYSRGINYVIYSGDDVRVVDAHRWLRDENGGTMGWFNPATGEIVVRENSRIDTVLHELGWHATYAWARDNAPELFAKMREYAEKAPQEVKDAVAKNVRKVVSWRLSQQRPKIPPPTHFYHQPATTKRVSCGNWVGGGSQVCCGLGWW